MSTQQFLDLEAAQSVRRIPFKTARVVPGFVSGTYILIVSGVTACVNMKVRLSPLIYIRCPEYWGIEVLGELTGGHCIIGIVPTPYTVFIQLNGIVGSKGIEVLGAGSSKKIKVPGGCKSTITSFDVAEKA
ncbi:MAG TPA: hypothetical protein VEW26_11285 [Allosphingosinicella sp.]|nr:hypothetical protein [Allosphingosinicella sp.]